MSNYGTEARVQAMRWRTTLIAVVLFSLVGAFALAQGGTLTFGMNQEPTNLDPHTNAAALSTRVLSNIVETLVYIDSDGEVHPGLALEWDVSSDATEYTFRLRAGVTFHDGTPFDADAVVANFERIMDPDLTIGAARTNIGPYESSEALDDYTVLVRFSEPYAVFLTNIAVNNLGMVSPTAAAELGEEMSVRPVGTGPFRVHQWVRGDRLILRKFEDYAWAPAPFAHEGAAYFDELVLAFVPESGVRVGALESGELQVIENIPGLFLAEFESNPDFTVYRISSPGVGKYVLLNMQRAPTDDVRVREAIHRAVNRQEMIDALWGGVFPISDGPLQSNVFGYWDGVEGAFEYDPERSAALLDDAGWLLGDDGFRYRNGEALVLDMYTVDGFNLHDEFQVPFQSYLHDVGIRVNIIQLAGTQRRAHQTAGDHHMLPGIFTGPDPDLLRRQYHSNGIGEGGQNASFLSDPELDAILDSAYGEPDRERRAELYRQAQEIIYLREVAIVPIYEFRDIYAIESRFQGLRFNLSGHPVFTAVRPAN